eukprot:gene6825-7042_t
MGLTTPGTGSSSSEDCYVATPGFAALGLQGQLLMQRVASASVVTRASLCPQGFYCSGGSPLLDNSSGVAPPGYYYNPATDTAVQCGDGEFKTSWDRATSCSQCGTNIGPQGWRSDTTVPLRIFDGNAVAGRVIYVRGNSSSCCVAFFSSIACVHQAGYGWVNITWSSPAGGENSALAAAPCPLDSWNSGGNNRSCTACPANTYTLSQGAAAESDCSSSLQQGQRVVLVQAADYDQPGIYTTPDLGYSIWQGSAGSWGQWVAVASSVTGKFLAAVSGEAGFGSMKIATSTNYGQSWTFRGDLAWQGFTGIVSSADGQRLVAVATDNIYTSQDYGVAWAPSNKAGAWAAAAASSDGHEGIAVQSGSDGRIMFGSGSSSGSTYSWTWSNVWDSVITSAGGCWSSVAANANMTYVVAAQQGAAADGIFLGFTDGGGSWNWSKVSDAAITGAGGNWRSVAMNAQGTKIVAARSGAGGNLFTATRGTDGSWSWLAVSGGPTGDWKQYLQIKLSIMCDGGDIEAMHN